MTGYRPAWVPSDVDMERPSAARMYDYYLGGSHNLPADQELAEATIRAWPDVRHLAHANRAFLRRAVTYLAEAGVDQFLDLGSGIPTGAERPRGRRARRARGPDVYVDLDPVTVGHGRALLEEVPGATRCEADLRRPRAVLGLPEVRGFLDFARPVAVLMLAVLPFVSEADDPAEIVAGYRHGHGGGLPHRDQPRDGRLPAGADPQGGGRARTVEQLHRAAEPAAPRGTAGGVRARAAGTGGHDPLAAGRRTGAADPLGGDVTRYSMLAAVGRD